ncbi:hypothetical protein Taro_001060 [Colocasia esculenta]|uniref:Uncharacterized protein n=1 Tax=Colocasia esculenta TaxID=4460 RepID=A0A843TDQ3_COLES|nr:hypothetical protein [Colocasia esculenta]
MEYRSYRFDRTSSTSLSLEPAFFKLEEEDVEGAAITLKALAMASRGRHSTQAREDEQRREERGQQ